MQTKPFILAGFAACFFAMPAYASTTSMANDSILILIALIGFSFINAVVQACCYFSGQYVQASFSQKHVTISLLIPIAALIGFIAQYESLAQFILYLGAVVLSVGVALIPMPLTNKKSPSRFSSLILLTGAIVILPLSIIVAPISLFSIALCHIGLKQTDVPPFAKFATILTLLTSYGLLFYWLYQLMTQVAS